MRYILFFFIISLRLHSEFYPNIISDEVFLESYNFNQIYKICKSYSNNRFTSNDISIILKYSKRYKISPINILVRMQTENSLVINLKTNDYEIRKFRSCGYGLVYSSKNNTNWNIGTNLSGKIRYYKYGGFENQIKFCAYSYRKFYDYFKKNPNTYVDLIGDKRYYQNEFIGRLYFHNASTFVLFEYNPHLMVNKSKIKGNEILKRIYDEIQRHK